MQKRPRVDMPRLSPPPEYGCLVLRVRVQFTTQAGRNRGGKMINYQLDGRFAVIPEGD
jgi:hypothetical protein